MFFIEDVKDAKYNNEEKTSISCKIKFSDMDEYIPYHAHANDADENGKKIYSHVASGACCNIKEYDKREGDAAKAEHRKKDLISLADSVIQPLMGYAIAGVMSDDEKEVFRAWNEYRKALEDVDVTAVDIEWPEKPE